jgi:hypothetical protein
MTSRMQDSLQAFSSSIAGLLSSRAVLSSVGVGDSSASPTAALLLSILQESAGRIATIIFAHRFGTSLEPECKMYRLLADVLNDIAFILDCLSPVFPKAVRVVVLSFSSVLRALCGVAAGSAKASLSAHFARWGNLGELNAKDSSQETVISLMGMLVGSLVVSWVTTPLATWTVLILLLSIHLETNRLAVRAVCMRTLNRQRATLVYHYLERGHVPTPEEISSQERIFERDGVLRGSQDQVLGYCRMGASVSDMLSSMAAETNSQTKSSQLAPGTLSRLLEQYSQAKYILWCNQDSRPLHISVAIKKGASSIDLLSAWWQALGIAKSDGTSDQKIASDKNEMATEALKNASTMTQRYREELTARGWDLDLGALETSSGVRIVLPE